MNSIVLAKRFTIVALSLVVLGTACAKRDLYQAKDGTPGDSKLPASVTIDTSIKTVDASKYAQARVFPGLVCSEAPRLKDTTVRMNFDYNYVGEDLRMSVPPQPLFSTGLYAGPGELAIVDVPTGLYNLSVQVGAWTDNLSGIENPDRDPIIYSRSQLSPGRNYIRNLYGGHIYILAATPVKTPVDLVFSNVLRSPDFILGETDPIVWKAAIQSSCVPWLELRSENAIFTVPREYCISKPIADPVALMTEWDNSIKYDFYQWEKLSANPANPADKAPLLPWRVVMDIKPVAGYGHAGYPVVTYNDYNWFAMMTDISQVRGGGCWGIYHELGHNNQQGKYWSWSSLGETSNNLFVFKAAKRQSATYPGAWPAKHPALATMIPSALTFAADNTSGKNFDGTDSRINDPFARLTPFLQLFEKVPAGANYNGWDIMGELYSKARQAVRISQNDQDKRDFVYETVCNFTGLNWLPFFKQWGINISNISSAKMSKYPLMRQDIWNYNPLTGQGGNTILTDLRSLWTLTGSYSTQEANSNGPLPKMLDGNFTTYWHTNYGTGGGVTAAPYQIDVDMLTPVDVKGFAFAQRENGTGTSRAIKNMQLYYSTDGVTYNLIDKSQFTLTLQPPTGYSVQLANVQKFQNFYLSGGASIKMRYFRFIIPSGTTDLYNGPNAALSELNVLY